METSLEKQKRLLELFLPGQDHTLTCVN